MTSYLLSISGTKCDVVEGRKVDEVKGKEFAKQHSMVAYVESSAKDNSNVDTVFLQIAKVFYDPIVIIIV